MELPQEVTQENVYTAPSSKTSSSSSTNPILNNDEPENLFFNNISPNNNENHDSENICQMDGNASLTQIIFLFQ